MKYTLMLLFLMLSITSFLFNIDTYVFFNGSHFLIIKVLNGMKNARNIIFYVSYTCISIIIDLALSLLQEFSLFLFVVHLLN